MFERSSPQAPEPPTTLTGFTRSLGTATSIFMDIQYSVFFSLSFLSPNIAASFRISMILNLIVLVCKDWINMTFTKDNCTGIYKPLSNGVCVYNDTSLMNPLSGVSLLSSLSALSHEQNYSTRLQ